MKTILSFMSSLIFMLVAVSCTSVAEGDRQLIDQIRKASVLVINGVVFGPEAVQAMMDVKKNSDVLQANLGSPKEPVPYSPAASADARALSDKQHSTPWWLVILGGLGGVGAGGTIARLLVSVFPSVFAGPVGTALEAVVEGVARVRQTTGQNGQTAVPLDQMLAVLSSVQNQAGVRELVRQTAKRVEMKIADDAAPDIQPPQFGQQVPPQPPGA